MSTSAIIVTPITRLEDHGKIEIFFNEKGTVENAGFQVPELRGFERFYEERRAETGLSTLQEFGVCVRAKKE